MSCTGRLPTLPSLNNRFLPSRPCSRSNSRWRKCGGTGESSPAPSWDTVWASMSRPAWPASSASKTVCALVSARARLKHESPRDGGMLAVRMEEEHIRELLTGVSGSLDRRHQRPATGRRFGRTEGSRPRGPRFKGSEDRGSEIASSHINSHPPISEPLLAAFRQMRRRRATLTAENPPPIKPDGASVRNGDHELGLLVPTACRACPLCRRRPDTGRSMRSIPGDWPTADAAAVGPTDSPGDSRFQSDGCWLPSLRKGAEDWAQILDTLSELYVAGLESTGRASIATSAGRESSCLLIRSNGRGSGSTGRPAIPLPVSRNHNTATHSGRRRRK